MTDTDRKRLRELAERATPGPWEVEDDGRCAAIVTADGFGVALPHPFGNVRTAIKHGRDDSLEDAAFIAATSPDVVIALLDALATAERERDEAFAKVDSLYSRIESGADFKRMVEQSERAFKAERERAMTEADRDSLRSQLVAMTAARDEACDIAERRGAAIDYLERKIDGYETTFDVADEIEHGLVDKQGRSEIEGAERLPSTTLRISELRHIGTPGKDER